MQRKEQIKKFFNKASESYDDHCQLQRMVGARLIHFLKSISPISNHILDLGCGTGLVTKELARAFSYQHFAAIDNATLLLDQARKNLSALKVNIYAADFDDLAIPHQYFDLAFSNMALQWSADISITLQAIQRLMRPHAILAFSLPLAGSLTELKTHCAVNHFHPSTFIVRQLQLAGFKIISQQQETQTLSFANTIAALRSIKHIGANFVENRAHHGLRSKLFLKQLTLQQLTYHVGYFFASKKRSS